MKKILIALTLALGAGSVLANGADLAAGLFLGAILSQPRTVVQQPPPVIIYTQQPIPQLQQLVIVTEVCYYRGQVVRVFDQHGRMYGQQVCL